MYGEVTLSNPNWMKYQQDHRTLRLRTVLDPSLFVIYRFQGVDRVSAPFAYSLDLLSPDARLELKQLTGQPAQLLLETDRGDRLFHGYVKEFARTGIAGDVVRYHMELAPWFDFLQYTSNCRIFQNQTLPEIIDDVFSAYAPLADYRYELGAEAFPKLDYCVQYNESDFHFISRLLEEAGIYYAFEHTEDTHTMVLSNNSTVAQPIGHVATVRYRFDDTARMDHDLEQWSARRRVGTQAHVLRSFDFKQPRSTLASDFVSPIPRGILPMLEHYSYDGAARFLDSRIGDMLAHVRGEESAWPTKLFEGSGSCRQVFAGGYFQLEGHFDHRETDPAEREFFVVEVRHDAANNFNEELTEGTPAEYRCTLTALRRKIPYRPLRRTPRKLMPGPQTATVVGPPGEELHADRYGRVKVQFHWDRLGQFNDNSSCWIRVASPWAGSDMGGVSPPRIGQEVVVDFLDGDPDRPLIINRVYNEDNMPPFGLESSGIKSKTVKGEGYNEISMHDTAGDELLNMHAQHNMTTAVGNDQTASIGANKSTAVGANQSTTIGSDHDQSVGGNETLAVSGNQAESVSGDQALTISGNHTAAVAGTSDTAVTGTVSETYEAGETKTISAGGYEETITGGLITTLVGDYTSTRLGTWQESVVGHSTRQVTGGLTQEILLAGREVSVTGGDKRGVTGKVEDSSSSDWELTVGGALTQTATATCSLFSTGEMVVASAAKATVGVEGATFVAEAGKITISAGGSEIIIDSGGVSINGSKIKLN